MADFDIERAKVLLKAAHELLRKCDDGPFVKNALEETVHYDNAECDGYCLGGDIEGLFETSGEPLPEHFN